MDSTMNAPFELTPAHLDQPSSATAGRHAPREDLYRGIHKAIRFLLLDTLTMVGRMDCTDEAQCTETLARVEGMLQGMTQHLTHENDFIHPALEARMPGSAMRISGEHDEHVAAIVALRRLTLRFGQADAGDRAELAHRLYLQLALFVAENLQHMHVEETAHNQALWKHYSDDELVALHGRLVASIPTQEMLPVLQLMAVTFTPQELADLMQGMKQGMPAQAFDIVIDAVRAELDEARWLKLTRALGIAQAPGLVEMR